MQNLRSLPEDSYQVASKNAAKSAERNKAHFDQRVKPSTLEEGDRVLAWNVRLRGKHKLEDKWEKDIYVVVKRAGDLPVYTVRVASYLRVKSQDCNLPHLRADLKLVV